MFDTSIAEYRVLLTKRSEKKNSLQDRCRGGGSAQRLSKPDAVFTFHKATCYNTDTNKGQKKKRERKKGV